MAQIILDSNSNLIQGDFDAATVNNRTKLQTSTTNATTGVYVVPNGSATSASVQVSNAADPTNASKVVVATNGATDTQIVSGANGSGSYLPLSFYTNNDIRFQMGNAGELNVRTAPGTVSSGTSGQVLTSGGPGAGVSWSTVGGQLQTQLFTAPGTWTKPASCTQVRVLVVGGGGGNFPTSGGGGGGGLAWAIIPVSAPVAVTIGGGGSSGGFSGGTSSFGPAVSATGGTGAPASSTPGAPGSGTVSTGTVLKTGAITQQGSTVGSFNSFTVGILNGKANSVNPTTSAYTTSSVSIAGAGGGGPGSFGGVDGAVVVEFIG